MSTCNLMLHWPLYLNCKYRVCFFTIQTVNAGEKLFSEKSEHMQSSVKESKSFSVLKSSVSVDSQIVHIILIDADEQ